MSHHGLIAAEDVDRMSEGLDILMMYGPTNSGHARLTYDQWDAGIPQQHFYEERFAVLRRYSTEAMQP